MDLHPDTLETVRAAWAAVAGLDELDAPLPPVIVDPESALGPRGGLNVLVLGGTAAAAVPRADLLTAVVELLYADASSFRPAASGHVVEEVAVADPRLVELVATLAADEADESGARTVDRKQLAVVARDGEELCAASGYEVWAGRLAHCFVFARPDRRDEGFGRAAASAAVAHALDAGLVAQWRTRIPAARAVAIALGFQPVGAQLCFRADP